MGLSFTQLWQRWNGGTDMRILMVGLDAAGRTRILYELKFWEFGTTIPTIGFNVETAECRNICFAVWDVGGQDKIRPLRLYYSLGTHDLIYILDSSDRDRIEDARAAGCDARRRGDRKVRLAQHAEPPMVHPVDLRYHGRRFV